MTWKNSASWAFFVTELSLRSIFLKSSTQDNHQGHRKLMNLKWLELSKEMFWRPSSVTKNTQSAEFFQTVYDNHGSEWESSIGADLWTNPPPSFVCWSEHPYLSCTILLCPLVGLRPPFVSHSFSFILPFRLTTATVSHSAAVQDTTPEGVLSLCWCHERSEQSRSSQGYMG